MTTNSTEDGRGGRHGTSRTPVAYRVAEELERFLGDPRDPAARITFRAQVAADDEDRFPQAAIDVLTEWGLGRHLVPESYGGSLRSWDELFGVLRAVSRRDPTLGVTFGTTLLGLNPVWCYGTDRQRRLVAGKVLNGALGAFAVAEPDHGSDLLADEVRAVHAGDRFLVSGTKWPISNVAVGSFVTTLVRTSAAGPRGFSLLLLDKQRLLGTGRWRIGDKIPTLGLRGLDLRGFTLDDCEVPVDLLIGRQGAGIEQALCVLPITRALVGGLSLAIADTALRTALRASRGRRLYGRTAYDIPVIREQLICAFLDIMIGECVTVPTMRAISLAPGRLSVWSSVTKYLVPAMMDETLRSLAAVVGARHFLREGLDDGIFPKLLSDHSILGTFEGTSHVNLRVIASQLPLLLGSPLDSGHDGRSTGEVLSRVFSVAHQPPPWDYPRHGLRLTNQGEDEIVRGWASARDRIEALGGTAPAGLLVAVQAVDSEWDRYRHEVEQLLRTQPGLHLSSRGFALARRHCVLHAAAACVHTWLANRTDLGDFVAGGEWLVLCLDRLLGRLRPDRPLTEEHLPAVEREMLRCFSAGRLFSLVPIRLGATAA